MFTVRFGPLIEQINAERQAAYDRGEDRMDSRVPMPVGTPELLAQVAAVLAAVDEYCANGDLLAQRDEILFSNVTANDIRKQPVMHVSVTPRQNTSPRHVAEDVDQLVTNLATMTGRDTPTFISIHSGFRARLANDQRRLV